MLVDITPHSLGIKCLEHPTDYTFAPNEFRFAPIITRNTPLPAGRSEIFCTVVDNQPRVEIDVFQGESMDVRRNHRVGKFFIEGLARVPAGNQLVVELNLNLDGVLKVAAREKTTGLVKQITIENALARFAVEERQAAQQRLERLWGNPEEGDEEPAFEELSPALSQMPTLVPGPQEGQRESVQARALLEKAERIIAKAAEADQDELRRLTDQVQAALTDRRWGDLTQACDQLSDVLFYLEDA